jgi:hypothetical protein
VTFAFAAARGSCVLPFWIFSTLARSSFTPEWVWLLAQPASKIAKPQAPMIFPNMLRPPNGRMPSLSAPPADRNRLDIAVEPRTRPAAFAALELDPHQNWPEAAALRDNRERFRASCTFTSTKGAPP